MPISMTTNQCHYGDHVNAHLGPEELFAESEKEIDSK